MSPLPVAVEYRGPKYADPSFVFANDAFCDLFGYKANEIDSYSVRDCFEPNAWKTYCDQVSGLLAVDGKSAAIELRCLRTDGSCFWATLTVSLTDDPDTGGYFVCILVQDTRDVSAYQITCINTPEEPDKHAAARHEMQIELASTQSRFSSALNAYPHAIVIYDKEKRLVTSNIAYRKMMSKNPNLIRPGMHVREVLAVAIDDGLLPLHGKDRDEVLDELLSDVRLANDAEDLTLSGDVHHRVLRSRAENGDWIIIRVDTTDFVRQSRALQRSQDRLMSAINAFSDSFAIYDKDHNLQIWNPAFVAAITDNIEDIQLGMNVKDVLQIIVKNGQMPVAKGRETAWLAEFDPNDQNDEDWELKGDRHFRVTRSRTDSGETVVLRHDITESVRQRRSLQDYAQRLETANSEITLKAQRDDLTGLGNRRYLHEKLNEFSVLRQKYGGELVALHIDLDRFKQINDTIGHAAGDFVLVDVANRIKKSVDDDAVIARIGGDEFIVLLWVKDDDTAPEQLANVLLYELSKPSIFQGRECRIAASIGVARTPVTDEPDLLVNSDVALYKAKRAGRGQVAAFNLTDLHEMHRTKRLADDIMRGLEAQEFVPYYQPQVDALTGGIVGVEVLARWDHPENGIMLPAEFLSVAADLNVVADIDRLIFEKAIRECEIGLMGLETLPSLSFNVSANRVHLINVDEIARVSQIYSGPIAFELLETIFLEEEGEDFLQQLKKIRDIGISIEVDDFGSGRASIVALQRIAPDQLKIDRRLVSPISNNNSAVQLVKSIIEIGRALGIGIVAEGVETPEQARLLAYLGATRLQGYFFSRPINFKSLQALLSRETVKTLPLPALNS